MDTSGNMAQALATFAEEANEFIAQMEEILLRAEEGDCSEDDMNALFRKRLTFLMNGNNKLGKAVNIQELADAVGVSRPAIRKYLKPKDRGEPTTPSALTFLSDLSSASTGKGLKVLILISPTFLPASRASSIASLPAPVMLPRVMIA